MIVTTSFPDKWRYPLRGKSRIPGKFGKAADFDFVDDAPENEHWRVLHRIADSWVPDLTKLLLTVVNRAKKGIPMGTLERFVSQFQRGAAVRLIVASWDEAAANLKADYGVLLRDVLEEAGRESIQALPKPLKKQELPEPGVGFRFDVTNPLVFDYISSATAELVTQVDTATKEAIRAVITQSFREGLPPRQSARLIREMVGLTERQANAVLNLRRNMEALDFSDLPQPALDKIRRARAMGLARQGQIDNVTSRYAQRLLRERALNIARTETLAAANNGNHILQLQALDQGLLDSDRLRRKFLVTPDDRLCQICAPIPSMNPDVRLNEPFQTPIGSRMNAPIHPQCRCDSTGVKRVV